LITLIKKRKEGEATYDVRITYVEIKHVYAKDETFEAKFYYIILYFGLKSVDGDIFDSV